MWLQPKDCVRGKWWKPCEVCPKFETNPYHQYVGGPRLWKCIWFRKGVEVGSSGTTTGTLPRLSSVWIAGGFGPVLLVHQQRVSWWLPCEDLGEIQQLGCLMQTSHVMTWKKTSKKKNTWYPVARVYWPLLDLIGMDLSPSMYLNGRWSVSDTATLRGCLHIP